MPLDPGPIAQDLRYLTARVDALDGGGLTPPPDQPPLPSPTQGPWINVQNYGAVGDGITDDYPACQAAINAAGMGGGVFFPPGNYALLTGGLVVSGQGVTLIGSGQHSTYLTVPHNSLYSPLTFDSSTAILGTPGAVGGNWTTYSFGNGVRDLTCNMALAPVVLTGVTSNVATHVFTSTAHGLVNGDPVYFTGLVNTTGVVNGYITPGGPPNVAPLFQYAVVNKTTNTFQVSATVGGTAIAIAGSNDTGITTTTLRGAGNNTAGLYVRGQGYFKANDVGIINFGSGLITTATIAPYYTRLNVASINSSVTDLFGIQVDGTYAADSIYFDGCISGFFVGANSIFSGTNAHAWYIAGPMLSDIYIYGACEGNNAHYGMLIDGTLATGPSSTLDIHLEEFVADQTTYGIYVNNFSLNSTGFTVDINAGWWSYMATTNYGYPAGAGVIIQNSQGVHVRGMQFLNNVPATAVAIQGAYDCTVTDCMILGDVGLPWIQCIYMATSKFCVVSGNTMNAPTTLGSVVVTGSEYCTFIGNTIRTGSPYGFDIQTGCTHIALTGNVIDYGTVPIPWRVAGDVVSIEAINNVGIPESGWSASPWPYAPISTTQFKVVSYNATNDLHYGVKVSWMEGGTLIRYGVIDNSVVSGSDTLVTLISNLDYPINIGASMANPLFSHAAHPQTWPGSFRWDAVPNTSHGWSTNPGPNIEYSWCAVDTHMHIEVTQYSVGVSNAATKSMVLPVAVRNNATYYPMAPISYIVDDGVTQPSPGLAVATPGSTTLTLYKTSDPAAGGDPLYTWSSKGVCRVAFEMDYEFGPRTS